MLDQIYITKPNKFYILS